VVGVVAALARKDVARRFPRTADRVGVVVAGRRYLRGTQQFDVLDAGLASQVHGDARGHDRVLALRSARLDHLVAQAVHDVEVVFRSTDHRVVALTTVQHHAAEVAGAVAHHGL
ncbi:hypothetical protein C8232_13040, partial [Paracidovorax avenae]